MILDLDYYSLDWYLGYKITPTYSGNNIFLMLTVWSIINSNTIQNQLEYYTIKARRHDQVLECITR